MCESSLIYVRNWKAIFSIQDRLIADYKRPCIHRIILRAYLSIWRLFRGLMLKIVYDFLSFKASKSFFILKDFCLKEGLLEYSSRPSKATLFTKIHQKLSYSLHKTAFKHYLAVENLLKLSDTYNTFQSSIHGRTLKTFYVSTQKRLWKGHFVLQNLFRPYRHVLPF